MFSWKKEVKPRRSSGKNLSQLGLFDIPGDFNTDINDVDNDMDDDDDLEAELAAVTSGGANSRTKQKPKPKVLPTAQLDSMIAASLRDIPSDEELSGDEDDSQLLNELQAITGVNSEVASSETVVEKQSDGGDILKLLNDRLKMYETAEENAKKAGESSRARRFGRGVKTLKELIKSQSAGKSINPEDIPPEVAVTITKKAPEPQPESNASTEQEPPSAPIPTFVPTSEQNEQPLSEEQKNILNMLNERKKEYKLAALKAKKENDNETAIKYVKIAKQFDAVISAVENNQAVDLSNMPGPPGRETTPIAPAKQDMEVQRSSDVPVQPSSDAQPLVPQPTDESGLITASSVMEALQQRLEKYKSEEAKAKEAGNASKARRMGRITKQFEDAIKLHKAGKPIPIDELPTPPGYAPIPVQTSSQPPKPAPPKVPSRPAPPKPSQLQPQQDTETSDEPSTQPQKTTQRISGNQSTTTLNEKQLQMLLQKQKEFKLAALTAKKKGEIMQAKEYLKMAKGLDKLIEASRCGLPVDMSTIPVPAAARSELEDSFDFVMTGDCNDDDSEISDILARMEDQLKKQLRLCFSTRDYLKTIGDVAGANRFENLALSVTRDLDYVRVARRSSEAVSPPKFHYETKNFSYVKCNTDLNDDELELNIIRGINYKCTNPDDIDTYVKFEFPYPQEYPVKDRTSLIKNTNNPHYSASFKIPIQRNQRVCQRVFKRHGVKFEVYSKGGFFRGDSLLGTVTVKLLPLENKVEIHDSFDIIEGRRNVVGKLEILIRIRDPLQTRQIEEISEKWLVLDF